MTDSTKRQFEKFLSQYKGLKAISGYLTDDERDRIAAFLLSDIMLFIEKELEDGQRS